MLPRLDDDVGGDDDGKKRKPRINKKREREEVGVPQRIMN
jgi:hypothetical protein